MQEVRCLCGKLLCKVDETKPYGLEVKCPRCKTLTKRWQSETMNFSSYPTFKEIHIKEPD